MKRKPTRPLAKLPPAEVYARDVAEGYKVASREVRLAARRHLNDRAHGKGRGLSFDEAAAYHAIEFFHFLHHSKGEWAGRLFRLEPWQEFILWSLFGWRRADGTRRFRTAYVEVARKNGKSTLVAGLGLHLFCADNEPGAEVYCAATKRDQARIVFSEAVRMRAASPHLTRRIVKYRDNMSVPATASKFEPLGADEDTLDGLNVHAAIVDELHAHKTPRVWDVLDTATAARRQPLMFAITTAGFDRETVCWREHEYCEKVLEGVHDDDTLFAYIATIDGPDPGVPGHKGDDWEDEDNWVKANPNLGVSVKLDDLRRKAEKAKADPAALNAFLRLHLNRWTQTEKRWLTPEAWNACSGLEGADALAARAEVLQRLRGRRCYGGLDLSSKEDLTAFVLLFPPIEADPHWSALPWFWMPEENVARRVKDARVPYDVWIRQGWIIPTEGNIVDYDRVRVHVVKAHDTYQIEELAFDKWNAQQLANQLTNEGLLMVEFAQSMAALSGPTRDLKAYVLGRKLVHFGNPVLRWMASNVVVKSDENENERPTKAKSPEKIDGIVALIMALGRATAKPEQPSQSYEVRVF